MSAKKLKILLLVLLASASFTYGQEAAPKGSLSILETKVTLLYQQTSIEKVLTDIQAKYKANFSYVDDYIPLQKKINVQLRQQPLKIGLDQMFAGTSINYYLIKDQIVLVSEKTVDSLSTVGVKKPKVASNSFKPKSDSLRVYPLYTYKKMRSNPSHKVFKKISLWDFFYAIPELRAQLSKKQMLEAVQDSTKENDKHQDSLSTDLKSTRRKIAFATPSIYKENFRYGFDFTPQLVFWTLKENRTRIENLKERNIYNQNFGISAGPTILYIVNERIRLKSGLNYQFISKNGTHLDTLLNTVYESSWPLRSKFQESYHFLTLPLAGSYNLDISGLETKLSIGVGVGYLLSAKSEKYFRVYEIQYFDHHDRFETKPAGGGKYKKKGSLTPIEDVKIVYNRIPVFIDLSYCIKLSLFRHSFSVGPSFKYHFSSLYKSKNSAAPPIIERPYFLGIQFNMLKESEFRSY